MPSIPDQISGATLEFAPEVNRDVTTEMLEAMTEGISATIAAGHKIETLWISSANDQHTCPSRHTTGNGVDISRINSKRIGIYYQNDEITRSLTDALQEKFELAPHRQENFGPVIQKKLGESFPISGHTDHIHWSVNGDHAACSSMMNRMIDFFRLRSLFPTTDRPEVCDR